MCGLAEGVIIAKEYQYHESCRRSFTVIRKSRTATTTQVSKAFERLTEIVQKRIVDVGGVMRTKLIVEMHTKLKMEENESDEGLITKNVKSCLINRFGKRLTFCAPTGISEIVFSEEIPTARVA